MTTGDIHNLPFQPASDEDRLTAEALVLADLWRRAPPSLLRTPHRLGFHLLMLPMSAGAYGFEFDIVDVKPGDAIVRGRDAVQWFPPDRRFNARMILLRDVDHPLVHPGDAGGIHRVSREVSSLIIDLHRHMVIFRQRPAVDATLSVLRRLADAAFAAALVEDEEAAAVSPVLRQFEALLAQFVTAERGLEWYADSIGCSTRTLSRACHEHRGRSAKHHLNAMLLVEAKRVLAEPEMTVVAAAGRLGFSESTNFVKWFKRQTGSTPSHFMRAPQTFNASKTRSKTRRKAVR